MNYSESPLIGVLSDTHDQIHHLTKVIEYFNASGVAFVVHCGDWISPFTLVHYKNLKVPIVSIFGNNDGDKLTHLLSSAELGLQVSYHDQFTTIAHWGRKIAVYHGVYSEIVDALVQCKNYDVVFHGHTHKASAQMFDGVLSLNPGSLMDYTREDIQGASFGIYDASIHQATLIWLETLPDLNGIRKGSG